MKYLLLSVLVVFLVGILMIPNAFAENVPEWVKKTAGWWATDAISETEFVNAIEYLIEENIIQVSVTQTSETSQGVPDWVKNTAGWWATDAISETEFVNAIAYLVKVGIINIESSKSPELIAEMWVNGYITDDEFLADVEHLIENEIITIQSDSITNMSDLPDWLVNNAGWWAARIITDSDFNFDPGYTKEGIYPCASTQLGAFHANQKCFKKTFNSHGLRGYEFEKEKPDNTFRIFTVGGSTTFGGEAVDDETWPGHLQQIINEKITGKKIEVINAGIGGATTELEYGLIKDKLLFFDPDLIIMYDGWNDSDVTPAPVDSTIRNWESVCKLGENEGFDTIIIVQPMSMPGLRVLTEQEIRNSFAISAWSPHASLYFQKSQQYVDAFNELDKVCLKTADFRGIFDYVQEPIFWDAGHTMSFGNKIIAENVFSVISPIYFGETYSVIHNLQIEKNELGVVYAAGADLSGRNFDGLNLQNAVFDKANLSNTSFKNTNIDGARFVFANLNNSNLLDRNDLSNINLAGTDLSNVSLKGKNLSGSMLTGVDLSGKDLTGTILRGADLSYSILTGVDLSGNDLTDAVLTGANLENASLENVMLLDANLDSVNLTDANLRNTILVDANLSNAILTGADLSNANLAGVDLSGKDLTGTIFAGVDLSGKDLTGSILKGADLSNSILTGVDLSSKNLTDIVLAGANLENANFVNSILIGSDLSLADLTNADLSGALFAYSNLSGVNLSDVILYKVNFWKADLSGLDFTVIPDTSIQGTSFKEANLSNSNFEDMNLSPKDVFNVVFEDKAYLLRDIRQGTEVGLKVIKELLGGNRILIKSVEVRGNDLAVSYIYFNSFIRANLESANFKNASLWHANFYLADLTNADLSGADLTRALLDGANLDGANLDGANLEGANLKCKNHPICNSG